jgi:hypothetical protein
MKAYCSEDRFGLYVNESMVGQRVKIQNIRLTEEGVQFELFTDARDGNLVSKLRNQGWITKSRELLKAPKRLPLFGASPVTSRPDDTFVVLKQDMKPLVNRKPKRAATPTPDEMQVDLGSVAQAIETINTAKSQLGNMLVLSVNANGKLSMFIEYGGK